MIGENKTTGTQFQSVSCYKSKDLVHWDWVNDLLKSNASIPDLAPNRIIERPKVIYNKSTKKYVLWMHVDSTDYSYARAGVAWSNSVCGDYTYVGSYRPLGKYTSRDMTAWVDDDGTGYLLGETTFVLQVGETYIYCGDRWDPENLGGLQSSLYVWLPMKVDTVARQLNVTWYNSWALDPMSGAWEANTRSATVYEAESPNNILAQGATLTGPNYFNGTRGAGVKGIGGPQGGSLTFPNITVPNVPGPVTLKVVYQNSERYVQYGSVTVTEYRRKSKCGKDGYAVFLPTFSTRNTVVNTVASVPDIQLTPGAVIDLTITGLPGYTQNVTAAVDAIRFS
ncbi:hypothetical protein IL306_009369 [Fusarium sp. DS 682]|nr:hypothetical protein IL306_009369 [Fusarium sp. DS 682]